MSADKALRGGQDVVICFLRNISRRLADQAALLDARDRALSAEQAKARFLSAISHEMRTPLTGMLGALDLLDSTQLSSKQQTYTHIMHSSGQILLNQINDALEHAQADQSALDLSTNAFDLDEMLDTLLRSQRPMAHKLGNSLALSATSQSMGMVHGDRGRVYQVVMNLVSNAIKFTKRGEITVDVSRSTEDAAGSDGLVEIQVTDTGVGIPERDKARIFEDFVRLDTGGAAKIEGTGLGLGIVRNLVVMMGGDIGVESEPGEGSLFWVRLPLPRAAIARNSPDMAQVSGGSGRQDILVVEDNEINRTVLAELLEKDGHRVWTAEDGADAVAQAEKQCFDTIVMDINMPVMDGLTAARAIRAGQGHSCRSRIIALSAHLSPEIEAQLLDAGMDAALAKPLRRDALARALDPIAKVSAPASPQDESKLIDPLVMDQLTGALDAQSLQQLLDGFHLQGQTLVDDLPTLKGEELPAWLHDFAGLAATLGARALHVTLSKSEVSLKAGDSDAAEAALAALPKLWADTCQSLDRLKSAA
jgi:CheY-like chemotaxis protein